MNIAFLLAAGIGKRYGKDKLFALLKGKPVIFHSLKCLENASLVDKIFIAAHKKNRSKIQELVKTENFRKVEKIITGGKTRYESVTKLVSVITKGGPIFLGPPSYFIIHNAANPLASFDDLTRCFNALKKGIMGCAVGRPIQSTVKKIFRQKNMSLPLLIEHTIPRRGLWESETPQVVKAKEFIKACKKFALPQYNFTDDISVLEAAGFKTALVETSPANKKITTREDIEILKVLSGDLQPNYSIGLGEDSHRFAPFSIKQKYLILGGVTFKNFSGLAAQSDGDVILHAICNALSSALGGGSLGTYAMKMSKRGIKNSEKYVQKLLQEMNRKRRSLKNCAFSIEAAKPRIDPITPLLKKNLSKLLKIPEAAIGITATSGEKLTPFGRGEAIRCQAIVLLSTR